MAWWVDTSISPRSIAFGLCRHFSHCFRLRKTQEYSEDSNSEPDVDLENQYYNSKALKEDSPKEALMSFQKVLDLETGNNEKGEWGFKALKQMIKINFKLVSDGNFADDLWVLKV